MKFKIAEKFVSINGEGTKAGQLAVFIRLCGCNLNCSYCDTKWANEKDVSYLEMTEDELVEYVKNTGVYNVTLTGGEPLLHKDSEDVGLLLKALSSIENVTVEVETNGSIDLKEFMVSNSVVFTMDYKLPGSGMEDRMLCDNFTLLRECDTVKFVAGSIEDLNTAKYIIDKYHLVDKCHVYISPVFGRITPDKIVDFMMENCMNKVNLQLQMHKVIWDPEMRGV